MKDAKQGSKTKKGLRGRERGACQTEASEQRVPKKEKVGNELIRKTEQVKRKEKKPVSGGSVAGVGNRDTGTEGLSREETRPA